MPAPKPPRAHHVDRWLVVIGTIATVVGASAGVYSCLGPSDRAGIGTPTRQAAVGITTGADASRSAAVTEPAVGGVFLDTKVPIAGQPRLVGMPAALKGQPGYERAIAISCPSNDAGDQMSEVTYETNNRYTGLVATVRPYRDPPDGVRTDLFVFQDNADRKPGAPLGVGPAQLRVTMGESAVLRAPADHAYYLRLRVVCERVGGIVILTDARLTTN